MALEKEYRYIDFHEYVIKHPIESYINIASVINKPDVDKHESSF